MPKNLYKLENKNARKLKFKISTPYFSNYYKMLLYVGTRFLGGLRIGFFE